MVSFHNYRFANRLVAFVVFAISFITYYLTMAPTMSFWDCGEFITCAAKLEVGHAPGAPVYLIIARFFSLFASSAAQVAWWMNLSSVFVSALTIMLLYISVYDLLEEWKPDYGATAKGRTLTMLSGVLASLSFAFTDTFWFSAVESEVYALSLFFTAITFWMILQWKKADEKGSGMRWLILISLAMGLSIGVHLLNLLTIPVLSMYLFYHKLQANKWGLIKGFVLGLGVLAFVLFGVVMNGLVPATKLEVLMVNSWGMPKHSGLLIWLLLVFGGSLLFAFITYKKRPVVHFVLINFLALLIGFSSYALIIIRAQVDTPINLNAPTNVFLLNDYLNRKQYGDKPLLKGPTFMAEATGVSESESYRYAHGKYIKETSVDSYTYADDDQMLLPRMHSSRPHHVQGYKQWANLPASSAKNPTMADNISFFINYQLNHMYFRYFMWNFAGRQNDIQGSGSTYNGNWKSGIPFVDSNRTGDTEFIHGNELSSEANNRYFLIPFILGLVGIVVLLLDKKGGRWLLSIIGMLFLLTGVFIVFYLNQTPYEPRERDYAYVGSFYAFSIFIGFGCFAILKWLSNYGKFVPVLGSVLLLLGSPVLLLTQNYQDHDRSSNYLSLDMARSYLESCEPNAILFTYGDNDTYPLWYAQEVEGIRTDVRALNIGLLSATWYVRQATLAGNDSKPLNMTIPLSRYEHSDFGYMPLLDKTEGVLYPIEQVLNVLKTENDRAKVPLRNGKKVAYFPASRVQIDSIEWNIPGRSLHRGQLALIDIIASNSNRPIYFTSGTDNGALLGLDKSMMNLGMVKKLIVDAQPLENIDEQLDVFMNRIVIRNDSMGYYNETDRKSFQISRYRNYTSQLIDTLLSNGRTNDAIKVIRKSMEEYPISMNVADRSNISFVNQLYQLGLKREAREGLELLVGYSIANIDHFQNLPFDVKQSFYSVLQQEQYMVEFLVSICKENNEDELLQLLSSRMKS